MFTLPKKSCAVRSNCTPAWMEKSAVRMTFDHGPGQSAGGVKLKSLLLKSAKAWSLSRVTSQCLVFGLGMVGSAVASREVPLVMGVYCEAWDWAEIGSAIATESIANRRPLKRGRGVRAECIVESFPDFL